MPVTRSTSAPLPDRPTCPSWCAGTHSADADAEYTQHESPQWHVYAILPALEIGKSHDLDFHIGIVETFIAADIYREPSITVRERFADRPYSFTLEQAEAMIEALQQQVDTLNTLARRNAA
jgi:hypothetical protein